MPHASKLTGNQETVLKMLDLHAAVSDKETHAKFKLKCVDMLISGQQGNAARRKIRETVGLQEGSRQGITIDPDVTEPVLESEGRSFVDKEGNEVEKPTLKDITSGAVRVVEGKATLRVGPDYLIGVVRGL